ncbi:MAG: MAPEG family protein [Arenimonas sp.]
MKFPILAPVVVLILWTLVMMLWMVFTRLPAMRAAGISFKGMVGGRGSDLDRVVPAQVQWKAHNYNHLMEQPTLFYAIALTLAVAGLGDELNVTLAWLYVGLRIIHSLVQATVNIVRFRFMAFAMASLALLMMAVRAGLGLLA